MWDPREIGKYRYTVADLQRVMRLMEDTERMLNHGEKQQKASARESFAARAETPAEYRRAAK